MPISQLHPLRIGPARGMTLIECLVATLLLSFGASAVMVAISASYQHQRYAAEQMIAIELAHQLLEEVGARPYVKSGPDQPRFAGSAEELDGYTDTLTAGGLPAPDPAFRGFVRTLRVQLASEAGVNVPSTAGVATVTVTGPSGRPITLQRILRSQ